MRRFWKNKKFSAVARDRTGDLQIFSLTLSQLSYNGDSELQCLVTPMLKGFYERYEQFCKCKKQK